MNNTDDLPTFQLISLSETLKSIKKYHRCMLIALTGKPSVGKSTFFKAATLAEVEIAPHPFTTIKATEGIAFVKIKCVDEDFNLQCKPKFGYCINNYRFIPIRLMDVPGLIEGSHKGLGL